VQELTSTCASFLSMLFSSSRGLWPCSCAWLRTNARSSNITGQFTLKFCLSLAISLNMDFLQRVYKSCCYSVAVMILLMYVDNNGIRHNCKESGQEFEKFVVMAMNPGADLDSLPILDNPNNLVVHAYAAFILELSYVAINNLPQLNSLRTYFTRSFSKQRLFISRMTNLWLHYLLGITDRKSSWC